MKRFFPFLLILIITVPAFISLINNAYFSMHDDQHIVRLFLLDKAIQQGQWYPRWVDGLGFGFGYPLFNFYPPFIYYLALFFHYVGFSLIWSMKLVVVTGFFAGAAGVYLFVARIVGKSAGFISATVYTYFFYHAVTAYVRGALAEFFSMAILPFVFLTIDHLSQKPTIKGSLLFGITFALLILTHPLIAFPSLFYMGFFFLFYVYPYDLKMQSDRHLGGDRNELPRGVKVANSLTMGIFIDKDRIGFTKYFALGIIAGLLFSAFFWLPSLIERKYTLTDSILTTELANYKIHYVYLQQFFYSLWGYGGSIAGPYDGMTFQLGKIPMGLVLLSIILFLTLRPTQQIKHYFFFLFLTFFSLFMTTSYSAIIWDNARYLWYLQFPWRFLTFAGFFISLVGGYGIFYFYRLLQRYIQPPRLYQTVSTVITCIICLSLLIVYQKYFKPQKLLWTNDRQLTTHEEIAWRVSRSSFEFVPKGVITKKTALNTTTLAIEKENIPDKPYAIINGQAKVSMLENKFSDKQFLINSQSPIIFRLNTYDFPGWQAYKDDQLVVINNKNKYKLITISVPQGAHHLRFIFQDTTIRKIANTISVLTFLTLIVYVITSSFAYQLPKYDRDMK